MLRLSGDNPPKVDIEERTQSGSFSFGPRAAPLLNFHLHLSASVMDGMKHITGSAPTQNPHLRRWNCRSCWGACYLLIYSRATRPSLLLAGCGLLGWPGGLVYPGCGGVTLQCCNVSPIRDHFRGNYSFPSMASNAYSGSWLLQFRIRQTYVSLV